jgi:hypothetical protein
MNFFSSTANGSSCSSTPSDWLRMAVPDCVPSATTRLPRKVGLRSDSGARASHRQSARRPRKGSCRPAASARARSGRRRANRPAHQHDGAVRGDVADLVGRAGLGGHHPAGAGAGGGVALLQRTFQPPPASMPPMRRASASGACRQRRLRPCGGRPQALLADVFFVGARSAKSWACCAQCTATC